MQQHEHKDHPKCDLKDEARELEQEGHRLREEARRLAEQAQRLDEQGQRLEEEARELADEHCGEKDLYITVNRLRFDETKGIKRVMSVDEIAGLVGLTAATAVVRRLVGDCDSSDPLDGNIKIKRGDAFIVTRKKVEGGYQSRLDQELLHLREGAQVVEVKGAFVIYRNVPGGRDGRQKTDVIVAIPNGYPTHMIDRAGLPEGSPLIAQVKGSPQEVINVDGQMWRMISYHPHNGGGGDSWDAARHGFDTYFGEIIAWLAVLK